MTSAQRREFVGAARELVNEAIARLDAATGDVAAAVGVEHDAAKAVTEALRATRIAGAKIELLIKRIPS